MLAPVEESKDECQSDNLCLCPACHLPPPSGVILGESWIYRVPVVPRLRGALHLSPLVRQLNGLLQHLDFL